jgi:hypothetical protein
MSDGRPDETTSVQRRMRPRPVVSDRAWLSKRRRYASCEECLAWLNESILPLDYGPEDRAGIVYLPENSRATGHAMYELMEDGVPMWPLCEIPRDRLREAGMKRLSIRKIVINASGDRVDVVTGEVLGRTNFPRNANGVVHLHPTRRKAEAVRPVLGPRIRRL